MKKKAEVSQPLTLKDQLQAANKKIELLEDMILHYKQDPLYSSYFAWARKTNEISEAINSFTLSLTGDDKTFERYIALLKVQPEQLELMDKLRSGYLKKTEEQLNDIQNDGTPLIEQRVKTKVARS